MLNQNLFKVVTWKESGENEKCPKCLNIRQDFMEVFPNVWGCYQCGCVFIPKAVRYKELEGKREQIKLQEAKKEDAPAPVSAEEIKEILAEPEPEWKCEVCGKVCGSKAGLAAHMRSHS
jgi:ribosomal protein L37AE/L43A